MKFYLNVAALRYYSYLPMPFLQMRLGFLSLARLTSLDVMKVLRTVRSHTVSTRDPTLDVASTPYIAAL